VRTAFGALLLASALVNAVPAKAAKEPLTEANAALQAGEADRALALLDSIPASAESQNLKCRVLLTLEHWDGAENACEQAVKMETENSDYHLWFARALGEKADQASFMTAYGLAKRTRAEFEEAVRLDPRNTEALADLGEFYADAPGVVGGGTDKAEGVASQLDKLDHARAHQLRAQIAGTKKDYTAAERELREAIAVSEHPAFQWMSLASFFRRRDRWDEMETAVQSGVKAAQRDRSAGVALFNGASVLTRAKRDLPMAEKMLSDYLAGSLKTEEAPAFAAHTQLARLEAQLGDVAGARRERAAALELARDYRPAQELKF